MIACLVECDRTDLANFNRSQGFGAGQQIADQAALVTGKTLVAVLGERLLAENSNNHS